MKYSSIRRLDPYATFAYYGDLPDPATDQCSRSYEYMQRLFWLRSDAGAEALGTPVATQTAESRLLKQMRLVPDLPRLVTTSIQPHQIICTICKGPIGIYALEYRRTYTCSQKCTRKLVQHNVAVKRARLHFPVIRPALRPAPPAFNVDIDFLLSRRNYLDLSTETSPMNTLEASQTLTTVSEPSPPAAPPVLALKPPVRTFIPYRPHGKACEYCGRVESEIWHGKGKKSYLQCHPCYQRERAAVRALTRTSEP